MGEGKRTASGTSRLALTLDEAAESLGVSRRTLWGLVNAGRVPAVKIGGRWLLPVDDLRRWLSDGAQCGTYDRHAPVHREPAATPAPPPARKGG